jgi:hypothetical protein
MIPDGKHAGWYNVKLLQDEHPEWFREDLTKLFELLAARKTVPVMAARLPLREAKRDDREGASDGGNRIAEPGLILQGCGKRQPHIVKRIQPSMGVAEPLRRRSVQSIPRGSCRGGGRPIRTKKADWPCGTGRVFADLHYSTESGNRVCVH